MTKIEKTDNIKCWQGLGGNRRSWMQLVGFEIMTRSLGNWNYLGWIYVCICIHIHAYTYTQTHTRTYAWGTNHTHICMSYKSLIPIQRKYVHMDIKRLLDLDDVLQHQKCSHWCHSWWPQDIKIRDQLLSHVRLFATPWITACQASMSITNSRSSLRLTSIESVMPSSHLILCHPLLLLPPIPPSISLFQQVNSSHELAKVLEFQL